MKNTSPLPSWSCFPILMAGALAQFVTGCEPVVEFGSDTGGSATCAGAGETGAGGSTTGSSGTGGFGTSEEGTVCGDDFCDWGIESVANCPEDCAPSPEACTTCWGAIEAAGTSTPCPGPSQNIYNAAFDCLCVGPCAADCGDNLCAGIGATSACQGCSRDSFLGCGEEAAACANDGAPPPFCGDGFCDWDEAGVCDTDCGEVECVSCGEYITFPDSPMLCANDPNTSSSELYTAYMSCACLGACASACGDSLCAGQNITTACWDCIDGEVNSGCSGVFYECANDI